MCGAAIYQKMGLDSYDSEFNKRARCMMQRELGYLTNHKCTRTDGSKCNTGSSEGWSYMVGCAPALIALSCRGRGKYHWST